MVAAPVPCPTVGTGLPRHDEGVGAHRGYRIGVRYVRLGERRLGEWAGDSSLRSRMTKRAVRE